MPTIYDIAKDAKVSPATVSRVMNGRSGVNDITVRKIRKSMEKMNFLPRWKAVDRNRVLLFVPEHDKALCGPYVSRIVAGITDACFSARYAVMLRPFLPNVRSGRELRQIVMQEGVAGCILISSHSGYTLADRIGLEKLPHVIVGHKLHDNEQCQVILDDFQAGKEAAEYLISLGHENIAMVSFSHSDFGHAQRHAGYVEALKKAHPKTKPTCIQFDSIDQRNGESAARRLFSGIDKPTAVIVTSEELALGFQREIREMGIKAPNDVSIIGFEDGTSLTHLDTPLTVMQIPSYELGAEAASMLFRELVADDVKGIASFPTRHLSIPLMVRRSTAALR